MNIIAPILFAILLVIIVIAAWWLYIMLTQIAFGQTPPTPAVVPTPVPTPVPPIQYAPVPPATFAPIQVQPPGQNDYLAMIMPLILGAGGVILAKFTRDQGKKVEKIEQKTEKVEVIAKDNMGETLKQKELIIETLKAFYESNPEYANKLTNKPAIRLETQEKEADNLRDKVAKS